MTALVYSTRDQNVVVLVENVVRVTAGASSTTLYDSADAELGAFPNAEIVKIELV